MAGEVVGARPAFHAARPEDAPQTGPGNGSPHRGRLPFMVLVGHVNRETRTNGTLTWLRRGARQWGGSCQSSRVGGELLRGRGPPPVGGSCHLRADETLRTPAVAGRKLSARPTSFSGNGCPSPTQPGAGYLSPGGGESCTAARPAPGFGFFAHLGASDMSHRDGRGELPRAAGLERQGLPSLPCRSGCGCETRRGRSSARTAWGRSSG
jgi:hypothetical protein